MMKVLILCLSHGYGGLELYVYREIKYLKSCGVTSVPVVSDSSMLAKKLKEDNIDCYILNSVGKHMPIISAYKVANIIKKNKIDIIHISWGRDLNLAAISKYLSGSHVKLIYSRHMEITRSKKDIFHRWFYKKIDKFLVISRMLKENAHMYLPLSKDKVDLLYLGVATPKKTNAACDLFFINHCIQKRALNIALFGRIEEGKAQHIMLLALKTLIENNYNISLSIIGHVMDKYYKERLLKIIDSSNLTQNVCFTGMIEDAIDKMPCFDVVVLTTPKETFGLVLVEAMRSGVAVIGTNAGGVIDIIDNQTNGLLFEPNEPESLVEALEIIYRNPALRERIAYEGKKKADAVFSDEHHFRKLIECFTVLYESNSI